MPDDRHLMLALLGSAVVVLRASIPANNAIGSLEADSDEDEIRGASEKARATIAVLAEFIDRVSAVVAH